MDSEFNQKLNIEYKTLLPFFQRFSDELTRQLQFLLLKKNVKLGVPTQTRIKSFESIFEKHSSKRFNIKKSILELQDLVGIRIILLFKPDIEEVLDCLKENFNVIKEYNAEDKLEYNQFGYSSKHIIISLSSEWLKVPTFRDLEPFTAEIQLRTMAQHIWAESSNLFQYKNEKNVPKVLLRSVGRISALLETVDLEYERLLDIRNDYIQKIEIDNEVDLNVDTLKTVLNETLPQENYGDSDEYSDVLMEVIELGIHDIPELKSIILKHIKYAIAEDKKIVKNISEAILLGSDPVYEVEKERQESGVFLTHVGLLRTILTKEYGKKWNEVYGKLQDKKTEKKD